MNIIIPMSGIGKRFIDAKYQQPKPLIEVDQKTIIEHVINLFPGEQNISFICNEIHLNTTNMKQILNKIAPTGKIYSVGNENRYGPVHAVSQIFDYIDDHDEIIVSYCDYGTWWNYHTFLDQIRSDKADGAIPCYTGFHPHMTGKDNYAFVKHNNMWMTEIREKMPFTDDRMSEYASNGTYYFRTGAILKKYFQQLMDLKITVNNEYYVSLVYNLMVQDKLKVKIYQIDNMLQWGTPFDLECYNIWSNYFKQCQNVLQPKYYSNCTTILPMAGKGSRFSMMGYNEPKPLLPVNGNPMIIEAMLCLPQSGKNIIIGLQQHFNEYPIKDKLLQKYPNRIFIKMLL